MASTAYQAYLAANRAAAHFITADAISISSKEDAIYWQEAAIRELKNLAAMLGLEIIKPTSEEEAA